MKNSPANWLTILITAVVGILFIVWHKETALFNWLIMAIGVLLVIPGVLFLIGAPRHYRRIRVEQAGRLSVSQQSGLTGLMIMAIVSLVVGVWMILDPSFFVKIILYLFAAALVVSGLYQIFSAAFMSRPYRMPWGFYIVPVLMVGAGVYMFCMSVAQVNAAVALVTGVLLVASAINGALQCMAVYTLPSHKGASQGEEAPVEEAPKAIAEHSESESSATESK